MSTCGVTYLDLLHELALQNGWALLLTAEHNPPGFAERSSTALRNLDVVKPDRSTITRRRRRLHEGELLARCPLDTVDHDLQAAAELLVGLLTRAQEKAA